MTEEGLIKQSIKSYLERVLKGFVVSISTTGIYDEKKGRFRSNKTQVGTSDLLYFIAGTCIGIEVKTEKEYKFVSKHYERLSDPFKCKTKRDKHLHDQIIFINHLKSTGNHGFFTYSIFDTQTKLSKILSRNAK